MLFHYFLAAFRNVRKNIFYSSLTILGLAIGIASFLLVYMYVNFERSYDKFHKEADRIYRITYSKEKEGKEVFNTVLVYAGVGARMKDAFPEIEDYTRVRSFVIGGISKAPVRFRDMVFEEQRVYWADSNYFRFFSFPLIEGNPSTILKEQFTVALSESAAKKYFGSERAVGKTVRIGQKFDFTVTGVFKDMPPNSHLKADFLISHVTLKAVFPPWWTDDNLQLFHGHLYVRLRPDANPEDLAKKFPQFVDDYIDGKELRKTGVELRYAIMPLTSIHLNSHIQYEAEVNGDASAVLYLFITGLLIISIAWVNYANLSTSRAMERAKEVGVRKVVGAVRPHLIIQFFAESMLLNLLSIVAALFIILVLFYSFRTWFNDFLVYDFWSASTFWQATLAVFVVGTFLSGFYPAMVLSSFKPIAVLKGKFRTSSASSALRRLLVVLQFAASVALIISTYTIYSQIDFMRSRDLGFRMERTLVVKTPIIVDSLFATKSSTLLNAWRTLSGVSSASVASNIPGFEPGGATWYNRIGASDDDVQFCYQTWVDDKFLESYEIQMLAGRNFTRGNIADSTAVVINRSCLPLFDFKDPDDAVGSEIAGGGKTYRIIGVLNDFHQQSLKTGYLPIVFNYLPDTRGFYSLSFTASDENNYQSTINQIDQEWKKVFPDNPLISFPLEDQYNRQYKPDEQFGSLLLAFSALAICIGCLGILGLSSYMMSSRAKEISIRKVLGSSMTQLFVVLSKEFFLLILTANVIAWPVTIILMNKWLSSFAFRIDQSWITYAVSVVIVIGIAGFTISWELIKAARANPVRSLRSE